MSHLSCQLSIHSSLSIRILRWKIFFSPFSCIRGLYRFRSHTNRFWWNSLLLFTLDVQKIYKLSLYSFLRKKRICLVSIEIDVIDTLESKSNVALQIFLHTFNSCIFHIQHRQGTVFERQNNKKNDYISSELWMYEYYIQHFYSMVCRVSKQL